MTMISFRVPDEEVRLAQRWADRLGVDRSQLLREALHRHLVQLASEDDARRWSEHPSTDDELALGAIAQWGPAEDWSEWVSAGSRAPG